MKRIITLFFLASSCCVLTFAQSTPFKLSKSEKKQGFKVLFDGTSLEQWSSNSKDYKLEDGCIVIDPTLKQGENFQGGNFYTKQTFSDFILRFEFKLTPAANNGLGIRHKIVDAPTGYDGMELQIIDSEAPVYKNLKPYQYHGSLYGLVPAKRGFQKPAGEWNKQEVIANGTSIKVILNGEVILDVDLAEFEKQNPDIKIPEPILYPSGHIAFLGHGDMVYFRNIRIKDNGNGLLATDTKGQ
jgi:hypothetical protein